MSGLLSNVLANRSRYSVRYPHSASSIGPKIGVIHGKDCWWEAVGPALDDFNQLVPDIKTQLESYCEPVSGSVWVTFSVYMIGKEEQTAAPTIMFFCDESDSRKDAMNAIKKSGILKRYPGFKTGNRALPPDVVNLIQPATDRRITQQTHLEGCPVEVFYDVSKPIRAFGMVIYIKHDDGSSTSTLIATANVLRHGEQLLYQSVSHAFTKSTPSTKASMEDCGSDYEIASDTDDELDDTDITSRGSLSPVTIFEYALSNGDIADDNSVRSYSSDTSAQSNMRLRAPQLRLDFDDLQDVNERLLSSQQPKRTLSSSSVPPPMPRLENLAALGSLVVSSVDKDWALVAITNEDVLAYLVALDASGEDAGPKRVAASPRAARIATHTSTSGYVTGTLSETPLYTRLPNSMSFQEVYKVQLDTLLANGDCGSGIVDVKTGDLYGHIVAGCKTTGIAYIMAAHHVFRDMEESIGGPLQLPSPSTDEETRAPKRRASRPKVKYGCRTYKEGEIISIHSNEDGFQYFKLFSERLAFDLSGFFETDFWTRIVLQASHHAIPIRYAVVALRALHKSLEFAPRPNLKVNVIQTVEKRHYSSAFEYYYKSVLALNAYLSTPAPQQRIALICCLLYICYKQFIGSISNSVEQTYVGLKILKSYYVGKPGSRPWIPPKALPEKKRKKTVEMTRGLQSRPNCDYVSKEKVMIDYMEEYLEEQNQDAARIQRFDREKELSVYVPNRKNNWGTDNSLYAGQQQRATSVQSEPQSQDSSTTLYQQIHSTPESLASSTDYRHNSYLSTRNTSAVVASHSTNSTVSTFTINTPLSASTTLSPGRAKLSSIKRKCSISSETEIPPTPTALYNNNTIEEAVIQTFVRIDGQGMFFGMVPGIPSLIWDVHKVHHIPIQTPFPNFAAAYYCWDFLMDRCLQFYRRTLFNRAYAPAAADPEDVIRKQYAFYKHQLNEFADAYKPFLQSAISLTGEVIYPAALIQDMYHKSTVITLSAVLNTSEMVYDAYLADSSQSSLQQPPRYAFEASIIPPLHVVATKCRHPHVRREAVALLFASPRQEGIWDGVLTARIGEWIMRCEEDGLAVPPLLSNTSRSSSPERAGLNYPSPLSIDESLDDHQNNASHFGNSHPHNNELQSWTVPKEKRVQLTIMEFRIPERHIRVKCQKALVGRDGKRDLRETVIAW
ncbi:hypothetical protein B0O99DRAFT_683879 [Bisporella sp. PMI_857]|nr:hypothetical protein B0O99DRAFT_683879 [Bisporella sp. PMI_857]